MALKFYLLQNVANCCFVVWDEVVITQIWQIDFNMTRLWVVFGKHKVQVVSQLRMGDHFSVFAEIQMVYLI